MAPLALSASKVTMYPRLPRTLPTLVLPVLLLSMVRISFPEQSRTRWYPGEKHPRAYAAQITATSLEGPEKKSIMSRRVDDVPEILLLRGRTKAFVRLASPCSALYSTTG